MVYSGWIQDTGKRHSEITPARHRTSQIAVILVCNMLSGRLFTSKRRRKVNHTEPPQGNVLYNYSLVLITPSGLTKSAGRLKQIISRQIVWRVVDVWLCSESKQVSESHACLLAVGWLTVFTDKDFAHLGLVCLPAPSLTCFNPLSWSQRDGRFQAQEVPLSLWCRAPVALKYSVTESLNQIQCHI